MSIIRENCFKFYWLLKRFIAPKLKDPQLIYEEVIKEYVKKDILWLDLGCGHKILPDWRSLAEKDLAGLCKCVGIDYDYESLIKNKSIDFKVRGDITSLPFKNNVFDFVTSNMVLEHIKEPQKMLKEVYEILKPNGIFVFHTPNLYGYSSLISKIIPSFLHKKIIYLVDGRQEEDTFTTYYKINTAMEIVKINKNIGFEIKKIKYVTSSARLVLFPPLVILELLWMRILMFRSFKIMRTNILAVLEK